MTDSELTRDLADKAKSGDRSAFDKLVEMFSSRLKSRVENWSQFRIGPRLDVGEVLQETFIRAYRGVGGFQWQDDDAFFRWLCGVAKNVIAESARNACREARRAGNEVEVGALPFAGPTPSQVLRRGERFERLRAALEELNPDYRQVLLLSQIEGLTMKEIAKRMERSPNAVKHLIARALRALKEHFGDTESFHLGDRCLNVEESKDGE